MIISTISLFPEIFNSLHYGVTGRAIDQQRLTLHHWNPRDFTTDIHRTVDDRPYGGGPGMVLKPEPLTNALDKARSQVNDSSHVIHLSPQGQPLTQHKLQDFLTHPHLILIAGRYEGIDERFVEASVDEECSIGDYVLSGGELPAMVLIDAIARLIPGVLNHSDSAAQDSFSKPRLDHPHYTRPEVFAGRKVPKVLASGDHQAIARWRLKQALGRTWLRRPDILMQQELTNEEQTLLNEYKSEYRERGDEHDNA